MVALNQFGFPVRRAAAVPVKPQLFLQCYFEGGWDQMLILDPRSNTDLRFSADNAYRSDGSGIYPAYDLVTVPEVKAVLQGNPSGVQQKGNLTFGPAIPPSLLDHGSDLCIVRGLMMDTLTHEVGRRYFLTGKFPRGLTASGSSATTAIAAAAGKAATLPNLAVATEAYNETFPPYEHITNQSPLVIPSMLK